jgi:hypothetical protein
MSETSDESTNEENVIEIVRSSSGVSTKPPDVPEIRTEVTPALRRERSVVIECTRRVQPKEVWDQEAGFRFCTVFGTIVAMILIYVFVNIALVRKRDECSRNKANDKVIATLITKDNWYVFRYKTLECAAPQDQTLAGKANGTTIPIFVSSNLKNCAYPDYDDTDCKCKITGFNVVFSIFGLGVVGAVMHCLCSCLCCMTKIIVFRS